jgi:hypothetical protein
MSSLMFNDKVSRVSWNRKKYLIRDNTPGCKIFGLKILIINIDGTSEKYIPSHDDFIADDWISIKIEGED